MIWICRLPLPLTAVGGALCFADLFPKSAYLGASFVLIATLISVWNIVSAPKTLEKKNSIVAATYESWLSILGSIVLILSNFTPIGKLSGLIKPDYGIAIDHSELTLGRTAHLKLDASWKDGTSKPDLDDYRCDWHFDPPLPNQPRQGEWSIEITDTPELFRPEGPAVITTSVWVTATPPWGGPVAVAPPKSYTLSMHNISIPAVNTSLAALELGQQSAVKVDFPNGVRPKKFTCSWIPRGLFERPDACDTLLIAPDNFGTVSERSVDLGRD